MKGSSLPAVCLALLVAVVASDPAPAAGTSTSVRFQLGEPVMASDTLPSTARARSRTAQQTFWLLGTSLLTFGVPLLDLPRVLEEGQADAQTAAACADHWKHLLATPQPWQDGTVLHSLQAELPKTPGGPTDTLDVTVNVRLEAASPGCQARVRLSASVPVTPEVTDPSVERTDTSATAPAAGTRHLEASTAALDVQAWGADPALGRREIDEAARRLARAVLRSLAVQ